MSEMMKVFLSLSLSGTIIILILFFLKPLYKNRLGQSWQYYIWLIVIVRLLVPFTPDISLVGSSIQYVENSVQVSTEIPNNEIPNFAEQDGNMTPANVDINSMPVKEMLPVIAWAAIALILLIRKITIYQSFVRYVKAGRIEVSDINILDILSETGEQLGISKPIELYTNNLIASPMLIGFFRPFIVLPNTNMDNSDIRYVIQHELTHYKRLDIFYKWLVQITVCFHWFNPFVYLMRNEINKNCELSCDETIIKSMDKSEKESYGDTLINSLKNGGQYKDNLASVTLSENAKQIKERLGAIMSYKKKSKLVTAITFVLTLSICTGAIATGAYATETDHPPWKAMSNDGEAYTYSQSGYYAEEYIFEIGRNLNDKAYNAYPVKATIELSDKTTISFAFTSECKEFSQDKAALAALKELSETLKVKYTNSSLPFERPLIVSVEYIGDRDLKQLAEEYYTDDELNKFSAIFSSLDLETQEEYCNQMFEEDNISFFSCTLRDMKSELISSFAEKAYEEDNMSFFANIAPYLSDKERQDWTVIASRDNKNDYLYVIDDVSVENIDNSELNELADEYYTDDKLTKFSPVFSSLDLETQKEYCNRMFDDGKIALFSSTLKYMNEELISSSAKRAYEEKYIAFFSNVAPYLSDKERQEWIVIASRDDEIAYLNQLTKLND